jgi:hypothetical protein
VTAEILRVVGVGDESEAERIDRQLEEVGEIPIRPSDDEATCRRGPRRSCRGSKPASVPAALACAGGIERAVGAELDPGLAALDEGGLPGGALGNVLE